MSTTDPFGLVGSTIDGRYAVEALVGEGGFSVVYRARHLLWDRPVAIKVFRGFEALEPEAQSRLVRAFVQEGAILAELSEQSTAIVQARDTATLVTTAGEWVPYLVLEWLPGETLETVLWREQEQGLPSRRLVEAMALVEPVARALALAHQRGICHRDLKPGNLVLLGDPREPGVPIKLLDFGTASFFSSARRALPAVPQASEAFGFTPSYGAPEQFSPAYGPTGPWTDVFALALVLTELMAGVPPMGPDRGVEGFAAVATHPTLRPTPRAVGVAVSDAVEAVFLRALAVLPADRWATVEVFWQELERALVWAPPPASPAPRSRRRAVRHPLPLAPAVAFAIAAALAASVVSDRHVARGVEPPRVVARAE